MIFALVGLSIRILMVCPTREAGRTLFTHGSAGLEISTGVGVNEIASGFGVNVGPEVGMGGKAAVAVGRDNVAAGEAGRDSNKNLIVADNALLSRSGRLIGAAVCGGEPHAQIIS